MTLLTITANADDNGKCGDNVYYSYNSATHTLTISGEGAMWGYGYEWGDYDNTPWHSYLSDIHSVIIEYGVTGIGQSAFENCTNLTSVTIPNSVTDLGSDTAGKQGGPFMGCTGLTSITIPNSVTYIGKEAFQGCTGLTSITIPNSVTHIYDLTFADCTRLTSINIPNSVTFITSSAFKNSGWYNNQADGILYLNKLLIGFKGDKPTGSLIIADGTLRIINDAFSNCSGLTSITIPNSVTSIGLRAFNGCTGLSSITIPNSVTSIEDRAFWGCTSLTSIIVENGNQYYDSRNNCNAIIDSNNQLIVGCKNTIIPNSVTSIGDEAFYGCSGMTSISIPNNVTSIGDKAFYGCSGLVYITLPSNLTSIGYEAFSHCNNLIDIYCYAVNVPSANSEAFSNPENITLHVPYRSLYAYQTTEPWNIFKNYESLSSSDLQASEKCPKPTISLVDGKLIFSCDTPWVTFHWSISSPDGTNGTRYSLDYTPDYNHITLPIVLTVFATKSGYQNSDVATYVFPNLAGDVDGNGVVNVADHVKLSEIIMEKE